jgi:hypothetical protein
MQYPPKQAAHSLDNEGESLFRLRKQQRLTF